MVQRSEKTFYCQFAGWTYMNCSFSFEDIFFLLIITLKCVDKKFEKAQNRTKKFLDLWLIVDGKLETHDFAQAFVTLTEGANEAIKALSQIKKNSIQSPVFDEVLVASSQRGKKISSIALGQPSGDKIKDVLAQLLRNLFNYSLENE